MSNTRLSVRVDENLKHEADKVYKEMGMNLSTAITIFLKQSVHDQSMPFRPNLNESLNQQARNEAQTGQTEKFNSVEEWWTSLNED